MQFLRLVREKLKVLSLPDDLLKRGVNSGFSGGEKKRNVIAPISTVLARFSIR